MNDADSPEATQKSVTGTGGRRNAVAWGAACALLTAVVIWAIYAFVSAGPRLPEIGQAKLDAARQKWKQNGPANYDITIAVTGTRAAIYQVEVRNGQAVRATRDGDELKDPRTLGTWSVPGMFDTMQSDVDHITEPIPISAREANRESPEADAYPRRYRRIEWGSSIEVGWEVTEFQPRESGDGDG